MEVTILRVFGAILFIVGLVMTFSPDLVSSSFIKVDAYSLIEKRVKWGGLIGFGAFLIVHTRLMPWLVTLPAILFWLTAGIVLARIIGIVLCGLPSKQLLWLVIELTTLGVLGFWYWKSSTLDFPYFARHY